MIRGVTRRFFIRVSYDGTKYRGVSLNQNVKTVESAMSKFLVQLYGNNFNLKPTSRTDAGVHGVSNIMKLIVYDKKAVIDVKQLAYSLNYHLQKHDEEISVQNIQEIPFYRYGGEFIKQRVYVYRLAVFKELQVPVSQGNTIDSIKCSALPRQGTGVIFHNKTCTTLSPPFCVDKLIESAEILSGVNNIYNCTPGMGHREMEKKTHGNKSYIRDVQIEVGRGHPMLLGLHPQLAQQLEFWEIQFKSHSYIYKQIRRMVGLMVGYAQGEYSLELLRRIMSGQILSSEDNTAFYRAADTHTMMPQGLFLQDIECDDERMLEECSVDNPYIQLLANISILKDILFECSSNDNPSTLQELSKISQLKSEVQEYDKESLKQSHLCKRRNFTSGVLIQTKLGVVKAHISGVPCKV
ncbi:tRNA pseudouridine synthase-like 1 [Saccostrea echinata]|uniref:tRNA pseudouridine synthase-like 1 n=1 Tax=Saccostrea echinata TaxID=191078 RepID=UPI002A82AE36|nr:tRNA pseudouridine synthase-like 1 [Saccostrea echinata]